MASRGAALVTGGARRIGRVLVATAAQAGFDVAIHVRSMDDEAEAAAGEVRAHGRKATILTCDLRKESASVALVGEAEAELGAITLLVNSASVFENDAFSDMNRASWDLHMETNLRAPLVLSQVFARRLPADREGLIVNLLDQRVLHPAPEAGAADDSARVLQLLLAELPLKTAVKLAAEITGGGRNELYEKALKMKSA